ncbi:unnamed protein product [Scytosiphon promiscuus]
MRTSSLLAISSILSVVVVTIADECHNICADVKKGVSFKSACSAFRSSLPKPKVSSKCQSGFKEAVDMNCYDACVNGGRLQLFVSEQRLDDTCKGTLKEIPRPLCHDACVRGYRAGVKDMSTLLAKRMAEVAPTVLAVLKEDSLAREVAQSADADVTADLAEAKTAEAEAIAPSRRDSAGPHEEPPSAEERKIADDGGAGIRQHKDDQGLNAKAPAPEEVQVVDKEPALPVAQVGEAIMDAFGDIESKQRTPGDKAEHHLQGVETKDGTKQDEDIYVWIEHVREEQVLLSLPITIDDVQKELAIFEGDDPMEAVLEFCRDNMPEEGAACADELMRLVEDKISPSVERDV